MCAPLSLLPLLVRACAQAFFKIETFITGHRYITQHFSRSIDFVHRIRPIQMGPSSAMKTSVQVWVVFLSVVLLCLQWNTRVVLAQEYDYTTGPNGPAHWGDLNTTWATCKTGMIQSPLAITPEIMVTDSNLDSELDADFPDNPVPSVISNNGHAIELKIPDAVELTINNVKYKSTQMHFHYPSEHTIANYTFPLELHQVHLHEVSPGVNQIAVIGYLFVLGEDNPFLAQFFDKLPALNAAYPIDPISLLGSNGSYGRYMGSLTTPACTENVTWTVMLWDFPTVSQRQLDQLMVALPNSSARPAFPSNGRKFYIST